MKWNNQSKEIAAHIAAGLLLFFGMIMVVCGFITPPSGEVHDSILWIFGQTLVFSGAVLGISLHVDNSIKSIEAKLEKKMNQRIRDEEQQDRGSDE